MRLRNIPGAKDKINLYTNIVIPNPKEHRGKWNELFCNSNPIHIELGMGKGQFVQGMAEQNPNINYIGVERYQSVLLRALDKFIENPLPNVRLLDVDAAYLEDFFSLGEISQVYLNFSDPWPKDRHGKRRLTHANFLTIYEKILPEAGKVCFKTDNRALFEFSLVSMNNYGMNFEYVNLNLHENEPEDNIRTEYENTWSAKGFPIFRIEATFTNEISGEL